MSCRDLNLTVAARARAYADDRNGRLRRPWPSAPGTSSKTMAKVPAVPGPELQPEAGGRPSPCPERSEANPDAEIAGERQHGPSPGSRIVSRFTASRTGAPPSSLTGVSAAHRHERARVGDGVFHGGVTHKGHVGDDKGARRAAHHELVRRTMSSTVAGRVVSWPWIAIPRLSPTSSIGRPARSAGRAVVVGRCAWGFPRPCASWLRRSATVVRMTNSIRRDGGANRPRSSAARPEEPAHRSGSRGAGLRRLSFPPASCTRRPF